MIINKKRNLIFPIIFAIMFTTSFFGGEEPAGGSSRRTDDEGHALVSLWKDYSAAEDADRPQLQQEILEKIMTGSMERKLYWDYCDAVTKWYDVVTDRNWKLRDSCRTRVEREVAEMDCPILTYSVRQFFEEKMTEEELVSQITGRADELRCSRNEGFYHAQFNGEFPKFLIDDIASDYECLLWAVGMSGIDEREAADTAAGLLEEELGERYPSAACLEFLRLLRSHAYVSSDAQALQARAEALRAFSEKYSGRAMAVLSDQQMLIDRIFTLDERELQGKDMPGPDEYAALRKDCGELRDRRESFVKKSGSAKKGAAALELTESLVAGCARDIDPLIEYLDAKSVTVRAHEGEIYIFLKNVGSVTLQLFKGGEEFLSTELENPKCSYFVTDTVRFKFPDCPDGDYLIRCSSGKTSDTYTYESRSISVAHREIDTGVGIYAADYRSGEPIGTADVEIFHDSKPVLKVSDFRFEGFTSIQELLESVASPTRRQKFTVRVSRTDDSGWKRTSGDISFWVMKGETAEPVIPEPRQTGRIFMDRSAFNPGDSVKFKLLVYDILPGGDLATEEGKRSFRVDLMDPDRKVIDTVSLKINEFGTAAGSFDLPRGTKGGTYTLNARCGRTLIAASSLTVDEFVLPAYCLEFDKSDTPLFSGDTASVRGRITSYSGHSLSSVKVSYEVESYVNGATKVITGNLKTTFDGRFDLRFAVDEADPSELFYYDITLRATALDGETWEWSTCVVVNPASSLKMDFSDTAEGDAFESGHRVDAILQSPEFRVTFIPEIRGVDIMPAMQFKYSVMDGENELITGEVDSGVPVEVSLAGLPSGLYAIQAEGEWVTKTGRSLRLEDRRTVLKMSDGDTAIPHGVDRFFRKTGNGRVAAQIGTSEPERWWVVEITGSDGSLLHSEIMRVGTDCDSVGTVDCEYDSSWPDAVTMMLFSFRDSWFEKYLIDYDRPQEDCSALPLSFCSFTDRTLPRSECTLVLQTVPSAEAVIAVFDKSSETLRSNLWTAVRHHVRTFNVSVGTSRGHRGSEPEIIPRHYWATESFWNHDGWFFPVPFGSDRPRLMSRTAYGAADREIGQAVYDDATEAVVADEEEAGSSSKLSAGHSRESESDLVLIRDGMDHSSVFLPFLRSDSEGKIEAKFTTSDRLSSYVVQVFAHDRRMRNAVLRREMTVSLPLEVSVAQPQFLYAGDVYRLRASVSNSDEFSYEGAFVVEVYDTADYVGAAPVGKLRKALSVGARDAASAEFEISVPHDVATLGLKVAFIGSRATARDGGQGEDGGQGCEGALGSESGEGRISDAVFVSIPVKEPAQTVTEAHSMLVCGGIADPEAVKAELSALFTGTDAEGADYREISLIDMITEAIPSEISAGGEDVLSRSGALYAGMMARYLAERTGRENPLTVRGGFSTGGSDGSANSGGSDGRVTVSFDAGEMLDRILSCRNSDGGFGWYEDFRSCPIVTAVVLERFAVLSRRGLIGDELSARLAPVCEAAIRYLDNNQFEDYPLWGGALSLEQYLHVRTMYPEVAFNPVVPKAVGSDSASGSSDRSSGQSGSKSGTEPKDRLSEFRKEVMEYLFPKKAGSLNGEILAKARRTMVSSVLSSDEGAAMAGAWSLKSSVRKLAKSHDADMLSLTEYAVEHPSGGIYYPNAVMPFRGLLESEAYAHALLCDLLDGYAQSESGERSVREECRRIAEGIRLWLMVQKETQKWDDDPAFLDAVCMVLDGSQQTLDSKIAVLSRQYSKPLDRIVAAGNGFTVTRKFYRTVLNGASNSGPEEGSAGDVSSAAIPQKVELKEGDVLNVGDRITAEYRVWNEENRSFVRLETPRYAALRPVNQLSGHAGGYLRAIVSDVYGWFRPSAYREVKADRTILSFDVLCEENTVFTEDFYVISAGVFSTPAVTVESVYSPHYRANDSAAPLLLVE